MEGQHPPAGTAPAAVGAREAERGGPGGGSSPAPGLRAATVLPGAPGRRGAVAPALVGLAGAGAGAATAVLVLPSQPGGTAAALVGAGLLVGWSFIGVGVYAWRRRPERRVGPLLAAVGFAFFAAGLWLSDVPVVHTVGLAAVSLYQPVLAHMLLAFPSGRLGPAERRVVGISYAVAVGLQLAVLPFLDATAVLGCRCPPNLLLVRRDDLLAGTILTAGDVAGVALALAAVVLLARRWRSSSPLQRRALAPVLGSGAVVIALLGAGFLIQAVGGARPRPLATGLLLAGLAALAAVPYAFLAGLVRSRFFAAAAVSALVTRLAARPDGGRVRDALAAALGDPSLEVAYWLPERGNYADDRGRAVATPVPGGGREVATVERGGRRIGALVHDAALAEDRDLVRDAGAAAALAMENERLEAELRARVRELESSRAEVLAAGDAERRRLERDLHDGAQQRLVAVRLKLGLARTHLDGRAAGRLLDESRRDLDQALAELRELARGLHPALLATRGLAEAVRGLADRSLVPVRIGRLPERPLPGAVELAAYFVVAECLTNVAKHAEATAVEVQLTSSGDRLLVEVTDDGIGGADPSGSGLSGLAARVAALHGVLQVAPGPAGGTRVRAEIPLPEQAPW
jgi:signal transduction histidine kinase